MNKPNKIQKEAYDFHQCCKYIESKYGIEVDNRQPRENSLWIWMVSKSSLEIHNGCFEDFYIDEMLSEADAYEMSDKVKEILRLFQKEFGDHIEFWIAW